MALFGELPGRKALGLIDAFTNGGGFHALGDMTPPVCLDYAAAVAARSGCNQDCKSAFEQDEEGCNYGPLPGAPYDTAQRVIVGYVITLMQAGLSPDAEKELSATI